MSKSKIIGSVIILANEDDAAHTIRPRLDAAGADTDKVYIVEGVAREGKQVDLFQLDTDIAALRLKAEEIGDVRLIIIDPPSAYLGSKVGAYKESDVRRVLAPLTQLAHDTKALVVMVVHLGLVTVLRRSLISLYHLCFERQRADATQIRVTATGVVEPVDVLEDRGLCLSSC
jgi:hypothetical protein